MEVVTERSVTHKKDSNVGINKNYPDEYKQTFFIQSMLHQESQPLSLAFGKLKGVQGALEWKNGRLKVCTDWRLLAWGMEVG